MDSLQGLHRPETYTIGFTENRYSSMDDENLSPSPDHLNHYFTSALDYAERTNKGAENIFLDKSLSLDRERHKSVGKINTGILDLVFLNRSYKEGRRGCESQLSNCSSASLSSLTSEPTEVPQHSLGRDAQKGALPDIHINKKKLHKKKKKNRDRKPNKDNDNSKDTQKSSVKKCANDALPQLRGVVTSAIHQAKNEIVSFETRVTKDKHVRVATPATYQTRSENVIRDETCVNKDTQKDNTLEASQTETCEKQLIDDKDHHSKWQFITERLVEANKLVREGGVDLDRYNGRYHTPGFTSAKKRLSFCQSSYSERSERERINNIRRRHVSQARTGPLDFNKLKRQITTGRSKSFIL